MKLKKEGIILYPYDLEYFSIVKYRELIKDSEVFFLLAPKGFGITNKPADYFSGDPESEVIVYDEIVDEMLERSKIIYILDTIDKVEIEDIKKVVLRACEGHIGVVYVANPYTERCSLIKGICEQYDNNFSVMESNFPTNINWANGQHEKKLISAPIVMICSMSPMAQKFEIELYLRKYFKQHGYAVSQIGSKITSRLFGFCSINPYIFSHDVTEVQKIHTINNMIKKIEEDEHPEVIIIGIPGGILPLTSKHHFGYGIYAYEIFNAISPDYTILSIPNGEYTDDFFEEVNKMSKYKFGTEVDAFFVSSFTPISKSIVTPELEYAYTKEKENTSNCHKVFSYSGLQDDFLFKEIESKLLMYGKYEQL